MQLRSVIHYSTDVDMLDEADSELKMARTALDGF